MLLQSTVARSSKNEFCYFSLPTERTERPVIATDRLRKFCARAKSVVMPLVVNLSTVLTRRRAADRKVCTVSTQIGNYRAIAKEQGQVK